ncbi:hypothetical protein MBCUT_06780 [Methanobrevibacter cuticularis]|uniref:Uncharacterized protein n=1 Tax=Methanobrevibacter cuticularis TaxID=47311 RepID=A0A166EGU8_9EURY|nr:hypothetical protein [Methanobrevibacter cuticularis]KZX16640.1 hypothetical protein MBCUT_06780 [Methanobrevibacter cuticularis]
MSKYVNATSNKNNPTFYLNRGDFEFKPRVETVEGIKKGGVFEVEEMPKGMVVEIDPNNDMAVKPFKNGIPIGTLGTEPQGDIPREDRAAGEYEMQIAPVDIDGEIDWVQLEDTHALVKPGTYLAIDNDPTKYAIKSSATDVIALETRIENETGFLYVYRRGQTSKK